MPICFKMLRAKLPELDASDFMALSWGPLPCELFQPLAFSHGALGELKVEGILNLIGIEEKQQWHCKTHHTRFLVQTILVNHGKSITQVRTCVERHLGKEVLKRRLDERRNEIISAIRFYHILLFYHILPESMNGPWTIMNCRKQIPRHDVQHAKSCEFQSQKT